MVSDLCSVLNPDWEDLGIHGWSPLPELQSQGRPSFYVHKENLFAYLPPIAGSVVGPGQNTVLSTDISHPTH